MSAPWEIRYSATYLDSTGDYALFNPLPNDGSSGSGNVNNACSYGQSSGVADSKGVCRGQMTFTVKPSPAPQFDHRI